MLAAHGASGDSKRFDHIISSMMPGADFPDAFRANLWSAHTASRHGKFAAMCVCHAAISHMDVVRQVGEEVPGVAA